MFAIRTLYFLVGFSVLFSGSVEATDAIVLRGRIAERLPTIDTLKRAGRSGESNTGFLVARSELDAPEEAIVRAENADRKLIYSMIAIKAASTREKVGRFRADIIRELSKAGIWLQDDKGNWYRK